MPVYPALDVSSQTGQVARRAKTEILGSIWLGVNR
jgi:hypothetical protein